MDLVSTAFVPGKEAAGFVDAADFEEVKKGGDAAITARGGTPRRTESGEAPA